MNTCLSSIYLKLNQVDPRFIRLAFMVFALIGFGSTIMGLPMNGDVSG